MKRNQFAILIFAFFYAIFAKENISGNIKGKVINGRTLSPVVFALVEVVEKELYDTTDINGEFSFSGIPVGLIEIRVSALDCVKRIIPNIQVMSGENKEIEIKLEKAMHQLNKVVVTAPIVAHKSTEQTTSSISVSRDEVNNSPGSSQDVNRVLQTLPSVIGGSDDGFNQFLVRGGTDGENIFIIDGMELNNLSHYGNDNSSAGAISILHTDFIKKLDFYSGGFPARYPQKLSSVVDVKFRDGSFTNRVWQFDFNMAGVGFFAEGPVIKGQLSYIANVRISFLDLLEKLKMINYGGTPEYKNGQIKLSYKINKNNDIIFNTIAGDEKIIFVSDQNNSRTRLSNFGTHILTGFNWESRFDNAINNLIISGYLNKYSAFEKYYDSLVTFDFGSEKRSLQLKNDISLFIRDKDLLNFGIVLEPEKYSEKFSDDDYYIYALKDSSYQFATNLPSSDSILKVLMHNEKTTNLEDGKKYRIGAYAEYVLHVNNLKFNLGIRNDYYSLLKKHGISPRLACSLDLNEKGILSVSVGMINQFPNFNNINELKIHSDKVDLQRVYMSILGYEKQLTDYLIMGSEIFFKYYNREPAFYIDLPRNNIDYNLSEGNNGKKEVYGFELYLQKKKQDLFFYELSYALFNSLRKFKDGNWYDDNNNLRNNATIILGSNINKEHGISLRANLSEGYPYTPVYYDAFEKQDGYFGTLYKVDKGWNYERRDFRIKMSLRYSNKTFFKWGNITSYMELQNVFDSRDVVQEKLVLGSKFGDYRIDQFKGRGRLFVGGFTLDI